MFTDTRQIYFAVLVLVMQKLSMRRSLATDQPLTATHDRTAAWAGIGSAVLQTWRQKTVRASPTGILSVFLYLGNILVLHITTPGLFSLETFNSTSLSVVRTQGLPAIASYNISSNDTYDMYVNCILLPDFHQIFRAARHLFHPMHTDHFITSPTSTEV